MSRLTVFGVAALAVLAMSLWHYGQDSAVDSTAQGVAMMRRIAYLIGEETTSINDPASACFLSKAMSFALQYREIAWFLAWLVDISAPGALGLIVTRTKHYEAILNEVVGRGNATQVVVMGAGYTTYGHRMQTLLERQVPVFELDLPAIQEQKRKRIKTCEAGGSLKVNPQLRYVPVDFGVDDAAEALKVAGFDASRPTVFIWEGVTMYVPEIGVRRTLTRVRSIAANGSVLSFSHLTKEVIRSHLSFAPHSCAFDTFGSGTEILKQAERKGESWLFGIGSCINGHGHEELANFTSGLGWELRESLSPPDMWRRYLGPNFREAFQWKLSNIGHEAVAVVN